jgi:hypothetical protein
MDYKDTRNMLEEVESVGYTFGYGLDNEPYGLRPIGVRLNELKGFEDYDDNDYAKGGNVPTIEKRVAEVNALIREGNDKGVEVIDSNNTWQAPMKYKPIKYTKGVLYISYEQLDLYKYNKGMGTFYKKESYKIGKNESGMSMSNNSAQKETLTEIARMYRKAINSFDKYGYADGGMMAKGGKISTFNPMQLIGKYFISKYTSGYITKFRILSDDNIKIEYEGSGGLLIEKSFSKEELFNMINGKEINGNWIVTKMAKGGVTFDEKVSSISKSLLKRKKVSPSVQKDYGKTYNKSEAIDSAKRIVGSMTKIERAKKIVSAMPKKKN